MIAGVRWDFAFFRPAKGGKGKWRTGQSAGILGTVSLGARRHVAVVSGLLLTVTAAHSAPRRKAPPEPATSAAPAFAGFRMEGDPSIEFVFGDTERYKHHVDELYSCLLYTSDAADD